VIEAFPGGGCESVVDPWDRIWVLDCVGAQLTTLDPAGRRLASDTTLHLGQLRLRADGRGVAIGDDGTLLLVAISPP
jgi:hypothetical protein